MGIDYVRLYLNFSAAPYRRNVMGSAVLGNTGNTRTVLLVQCVAIDSTQQYEILMRLPGTFKVVCEFPVICDFM